MTAKRGFLLIELMISFSVLCFLFSLLTHYIIEIKNIQQEALTRIEMLSIARNTVELMLAHQAVPKSHEDKNNHYLLAVMEQPLSIEDNSVSQQLCIKNISCTCKTMRHEQSLPLYVATTAENGMRNDR